MPESGNLPNQPFKSPDVTPVTKETSKQNSIPILEKAKLDREENVRKIRERKPQELEQNLILAKNALQEIAYQTMNKDNFEEKINLFSQYYENNLFNHIVHKTRDSSGQQTILESSASRFTNSEITLEKISSLSQSGPLDEDLQNTNYIFANCLDLPSASFKIGKYPSLFNEREITNPTTYQIHSTDGYVVPIDIASVPLLYHEGLLDEWGDPVGTVYNLDDPTGKSDIKDYTNIDTIRIHDYAKNIYTIDGFKDFFSTYTATFFDTPQEAIHFFKKYYNNSYQVKTFWSDEELMRKWVSNNKDYETMKNMKELMKTKHIIPPICPEFQFKNKVQATMLETK